MITLTLLLALADPATTTTTTTTTPPTTTTPDGAAAALIEAPEKLRIAVTSLEVRDAPADLAVSIEEVMADELARGGRFAVVSARDVGSLARLDSQKQLLGCNSDDCMHALSSLLDAPRALTGSLGSLGGETLLLAVQLRDTRDGAVLARAVVRLQGTREERLEGARAAARQIQQIPARLHLTHQIQGARVFLDDALIGTTPLDETPVDVTGEHLLRVEHFDYPPLTTRVELVAGRTTRVKVEMSSYADIEASRSLRTGVGWALVGGGVVAGGGAALAVMSGMERKAAYDALDVRAVTQVELDATARESLAGLIGGGVLGGAAVGLLGVGVAFLLVETDDDRRARE